MMTTQFPRQRSLWADLKREIVRYRRPIIVIGQLALVIVSCYVAFWLRFDGEIPDAEMALFYRTLPWLVLFRAVAFVVFRLYEGLWRYTSIWDLGNIILGVLTSTAAFWIFVRWVLQAPSYPRSIFIIDSVLLILSMGGIRLLRRIRHEFIRPKADRTVLIFGAGDAGEMLVRDMIRREGVYHPIGFVDDDRRKVGARIHGVRVLGTRRHLRELVERLQPHELVVAVPSLAASVMRDIVTALEPYKTRISTLPNLTDIVDGRVSVTQVRELSIEDLLPRAPVGLDVDRVRHLVEGRSVLVTGAGGSIGSELCRQLVKLGPGVLVLLERHENSLYTITSELQDAGFGGVIRPVIGDITDRPRLDRVMADYRPSLVFHAAAHKHVPMMELNVCEAVKNNVTGTRMVVEAAIRHEVERFILISTDKAVEPSSVMGATKRVAELVVQAMPAQNATSLAAVRFGNVLGSNGSVVPRFQAQIRAGGPVTVTHPEMRRYFMLIPEAVQLVLRAASLPSGRDVYVLDMGDQINLTDMARNLIRLSGFIPDEEIPVRYIGLRPGEKLSERLVADDERVEPTRQDKVLKVSALRTAVMPSLERIRDLELRAVHGDAAAVIKLLCEIVPTFTPMEVPEVVASVAAESSKRPAAAYLRHVALARTPGPREYGNRRVGPPDRRAEPRGGRRLLDRVRLAGVAAFTPHVTPQRRVEDDAAEPAASAKS